tara:strand:- start:5789 stop:9532 length:3744 start_codon:yes stop_codon:yes gene_type:complete
MAYTFNNNNSVYANSIDPNRGDVTVTTDNTSTPLWSDPITSSIDNIVLDTNVVNSTTINRTFGGPDDFIELHIYNTNNVLLHSEYNFKDYTFPSNSTNNTISNEIQVNPEEILKNRGFFTGKYRIKLNLFKHKIFNSSIASFSILEMSSDSRELRCVAPNATNNTLEPAVSEFIASLNSTPYFQEYSLNFGQDILIPAINIHLDKNHTKYQVAFRSLYPITSNIGEGTMFSVVEEIINPFIIDYDLGVEFEIDGGLPLRGPNYDIDIKLNNSIPTGLKSYNDIMSYNLTSSFHQLLSKLQSPSVDLDIDYTYIRPTHSSSIEDTFHFENFTHFSSATTRLKNFKDKIKLIELYTSKSNHIDTTPAATRNSPSVRRNKHRFNHKKQEIIKNFDGYEEFLYFTSGSKFTWPKQNETQPYELYSVTSSNVIEWFGNEDSYFGNYGGQLLSASLFDRQNPHNLKKLIPNHITDNINNKMYIDFINMVGEYFDGIWTYIKHITEVHDASDNKGISKDLVYYQLSGLGIETFDQFESANLIEYILGNPSGSQLYSTMHLSGSATNETLITASNAPSIPKKDIAKEIWKRLYHNASYLLKTKGTERGIRALMSCYGVPHTILNIKEFGGSTTVSGPLKDIKYAEHYKTFTYQKSGLALKGDSGTSGYFIKTPWGSTNTLLLSSSAKTVEFRIKPIRPSSDISYHLFSLSGSNGAKDPSLVLTPYQGDDLYVTNDSEKYGKIDLYINGSSVASTDNFPVYNGDFWNIFIGTKGTSGSAANIDFGAYQSNFLKSVFHYTATYSQTEADRKLTFGDPYKDNSNTSGSSFAFFGGVPDTIPGVYTLNYDGYIQEIKYHFHKKGTYERLFHSTLKKHALEPFMYAGNNPSSSFDEVVLRLPLGSNDLEVSSSFHPNEDINYLDNVSSSLPNPVWEEIIEDHYLPTPDTVGISMTSEKVRIDDGVIDDNILSPFEKKETSTLDRQPPDFEDLGIYFSPSMEMNEDIIYTLGSFRLDDYIGSPLPASQSADNYTDLTRIKDIYFKKVKSRYNYWAYIKQIQYIDHTLFKLIEQFVPFRANTKTGLLIEPHYLERTKIPRKHTPSRSDGQTMTPGLHQHFEIQITSDYEDNKLYQVAPSNAYDFGVAANIRGQWDPGSYISYHSNPHKFQTESKGSYYRKEQGTNGTIPVYDDYMNPANIDPNRENQQACQSPIKPFNPSTGKRADYKAHESSVLLGNAIGGRLSNRYYKYKDYYMKSSSLY